MIDSYTVHRLGVGSNNKCIYQYCFNETTRLDFTFNLIYDVNISNNFLWFSELLKIK